MRINASLENSLLQLVHQKIVSSLTMLSLFGVIALGSTKRFLARLLGKYIDWKNVGIAKITRSEVSQFSLGIITGSCFLICFCQ